VVHAMQYMVTEQLGMMLTGAAPLDYIQDIHTTIRYILNVVVTRQRPRFLLKSAKYRRAKARVFGLGRQMIDEYRANAGKGDSTPRRNFVDDIMAAHQSDPELISGRDLILTLTGPYIAGLETVANTTAACVYTILKHPEVLARVQSEADALFAERFFDEAEMMRGLPSVNGAIMETMRLYPVAVAQMRTAARDFDFAGFRIRSGEPLYLATSVPHFMEEYYSEPTRFDIDRFRKPRAEHLQPGVYSPYGRGPHTCLGKSLADVQMAISVARLFHRLDMSLESASYQLATRTTPTPGPSMRFKIKVNGYRH
jgi:cytochrome P450